MFDPPSVLRQFLTREAAFSAGLLNRCVLIRGINTNLRAHPIPVRPVDGLDLLAKRNTCYFSDSTNTEGKLVIGRLSIIHVSPRIKCKFTIPA